MGGKVSTWMFEAPTQELTIVQRGITLARLPDGTARLLWIFDEEDSAETGLAVHLTDTEAQNVFDTPAQAGLLERVRSTLTHADAVLWRSDPGSLSARLISIPSEGTEESFWGYVEGLAEEGFPIGPLTALPFHQSIAAITGDHR